MTTPQKLSFTDVVKGIDLFDTVNVPSVAVVENMAYYNSVDGVGLADGLQQAVGNVLRMDDDAISTIALREGLDDGGSQDTVTLKAAVIADLVNKRASSRRREYIFGKGHRGRLADMWGITNTIQVPLVEDVASCGDTGVPFVVANANSEHSLRFLELAQAVVREVAKLKHSAVRRPALSYQSSTRTITVDTIKDKQEIAAADLRRQCKCALCVEEFSGRPLLDPASVPDDIVPSEFAPIGNYAVSVQWSDGHSSLYPYASFAIGYEPKTKRVGMTSF